MISKNKSLAVLTLLILTTPFLGAQDFHLNDVIIKGNTCTGLDCNNSEDFGLDIHRYKESNLRIHFDDVSASGSFPKNDWRIIINDSNNGGDEYFMIEDATADNDLFRLDAGAPDDAIRMLSDGKIGLGIANPQVKLHLFNTDSPALRFDQDGSNGAQIWDLMGNESSFSISDVSNGAVVPFQIDTNSIQNSIHIQPGIVVMNADKSDVDTRIKGDTASNLFYVDAGENKIAIGHDSPTEILDVFGNIKTTGLIIPSNASNGHVLTSSATGVASWTAIPSGKLIEDIDSDTRILTETTPDDDHIRFQVRGTEVMVIDTAGIIGIGVSAPQHSLHLAGDLGMTGGVYGVSDQRIKKNIGSIKDAMQIIRALDGKTYEFKTEEFTNLNLSENKQYGLIAQDVGNIVKELVIEELITTKTRDGETLTLKGVNYEQLIPILINAMKEQDHLVSKQQEMISYLISEQQLTAAHLENIQSQLDALAKVNAQN